MCPVLEHEKTVLLFTAHTIFTAFTIVNVKYKIAEHFKRTINQIHLII